MKNEEIKKIQKEEYPKGKIILKDGRMLDCYPVASEDDLKEDNLKLDKSDRFFTLGKKRLNASKESDKQKLLFINNAFFLLAHKDRILSDSRMFLCPIDIQSGLAYSGTTGFRNPTLDIYIEWWLQVNGGMHIDEKGRKSLIYRLSGSNLTGANCCGAVFEDGTIEDVQLHSFSNYWKSFIHINKRYSEAKQIYQAYTLQEVLNILDQDENNNKEYAHTIETLFMKHEIEILNQRIERIRKDRDWWRKEYSNMLLKYNEEKIRRFYSEYQAFEINANMEIDWLKEQKTVLKQERKSERMKNTAYQRKLTPLNKRIKELESEIRKYKYEKVWEMFPKGDITFTMIENFIHL